MALRQRLDDVVYATKQERRLRVALGVFASAGGRICASSRRRRWENLGGLLRGGPPRRRVSGRLSGAAPARALGRGHRAVLGRHPRACLAHDRVPGRGAGHRAGVGAGSPDAARARAKRCACARAPDGLARDEGERAQKEGAKSGTISATFRAHSYRCWMDCLEPFL